MLDAFLMGEGGSGFDRTMWTSSGCAYTTAFSCRVEISVAILTSHSIVLVKAVWGSGERSEGGGVCRLSPVAHACKITLYTGHFIE